MINVTLTNNYCRPLLFNGVEAFPPGTTNSTGDIGGLNIIEVPGVGPICLLDLGQQVIDGYDFIKGTWGVLIRYQTGEIYARYEASGTFNITLDWLGNIDVQPVNAQAVMPYLKEISLIPSPNN